MKKILYTQCINKIFSHVFLGVASSHFFVKKIMYIDCKCNVFLLFLFFNVSSIP